MYILIALYLLYVMYTLHFHIVARMWVARTVQRVLRSLEQQVQNPRYTHYVQRVLDRMEDMDTNRTRDLLADLADEILQRRNTLQPVKYLFDEERVCPVSHETIVRGDNVLVLPCGHVGKAEAMGEWLRASPSCPLCRTQIFNGRSFFPSENAASPSRASNIRPDGTSQPL